MKFWVDLWWVLWTYITSDSIISALYYNWVLYWQTFCLPWYMLIYVISHISVGGITCIIYVQRFYIGPVQARHMTKARNTFWLLYESYAGNQANVGVAHMISWDMQINSWGLGLLHCRASCNLLDFTNSLNHRAGMSRNQKPTQYYLLIYSSTLCVYFVRSGWLLAIIYKNGFFRHIKSLESFFPGFDHPML